MKLIKATLTGDNGRSVNLTSEGLPSGDVTVVFLQGAEIVSTMAVENVGRVEYSDIYCQCKTIFNFLHTCGGSNLEVAEVNEWLARVAN